MGVDVFGHTLSFMPDNFLDESLVNFLFGEERDAGVSCIMRAVSVIDRFFFCFINDEFPETELKHQRNPVRIIIIEMEIFPSQRDESEIIHSGEYTRLENTIAAAREALQIAQDTQNTIDAAEAVRQAQERLREAAEKAREIKESRREDDTAKAIAKCVEAMEAAIEQTKKCLTATEEANKIIISQSGLDAILAAVKDYYERIRELETDININVDGGTPKSTDLLLVKGGTPFTTNYDKYIAGTSHTI